MAGYSDGSVYLWKGDSTKSPVLRIYVKAGPNYDEEPRCPVTSICCSAFNKADMVFVAGGQPISSSSNGIQCTMISLKNEEILGERWINVDTFPHDYVFDFCVIHEKQPWLTASNPTHVFMMTQSGKISIIMLQYQSGGTINWDMLPIPKCLSFYQHSLSSVCFLQYHLLSVASLMLFPEVSKNIFSLKRMIRWERNSFGVKMF